MGATTAFKNKVINHFLRNTPQTPATGFFLGALTAVSSEPAGTVTEVSTSGTAYARQAITFTAPGTGDTTSTATISYPIATAAYGAPVTHYGLYTASSGGVPELIFALGTPRTVGVGDQLVVDAGDVDFSM